MSPEVRDFVRRATQGDPPPRLVVEVGSREVAGGGVRGLFGGAACYTGVDLVPGLGVDVVADAAVWRPPAPCDLVVCCEVLEHSPDARAILRNASGMLRPGGRLVVTCAGPGRAPHSAADGGPLRPGEYYRNVEPDDLAGWLRAFPVFVVEAFEYHAERGDLYAAGRRGDG
jgi:SAM-dependent methyltransferase